MRWQFTYVTIFHQIHISFYCWLRNRKKEVIAALHQFYDIIEYENMGIAENVILYYIRIYI